MPMVSKIGRVGIYNEEVSSINSQDPLITWSDKVTWKIKYVIISTITSSMSIKLGKVVCYYKGLPHVKSHNPLNTWSHEVT